MLITGICTECSEKSDDELEVLGKQQMRKIWPDLMSVEDGLA